MTVARMVHCFIPEKKVAGIKAATLTKIFVWLDIVSFLVQAAGGTVLSGNPPESTRKLGQNIYMCGVGVQQLFIVLFMVLAIRFHRRMAQLDRERMLDRGLRWKAMIYTIYAVLALITVSLLSGKARPESRANRNLVDANRVSTV
jgi:RTA1 like protein